MLIVPVLFVYVPFRHHPFFSAHFQYQDLIASILLGKTIPPLSIDGSLLLNDHELFQELLSKPNIEEEVTKNLQTFQPPIKTLKNPSLLGTINPTHFPALILSVLDNYIRLQIKTTPSYLGIAPNYHICIPAHDQMILEIAHYSFDFLFSLLSIKNIVRFIRAIFLEQPILILSQSLTCASSIVSSIIPILSPMNYQCTCLTILPNTEQFLDFLDSPVPFIFGAVPSPELNDHLRTVDTSNLVIIDLDKDEVQYPESTPHMPHAEELRTQLKKIIKKHTPNITDLHINMKSHHKLKYSFSKEMVENILKIIQNQSNMWLSDDRVIGCRARDLDDDNKVVIVFVEQTYLATLSNEDLPYMEFFERLIQTQTFSHYATNLVQSFDCQ